MSKDPLNTVQPFEGAAGFTARIQALSAAANGLKAEQGLRNTVDRDMLDEKEQCITYFGYGSLVNRATRASNESAYPARLYGWQRVWGHRVSATSHQGETTNYRCCSLSIQKQHSEAHGQGAGHAAGHAGQEPNYIDGVIASVRLSELPMLDERESGYDRVILPASDLTLPESCQANEIHVYVSDATHSGPANGDYPILQSYIDCVLAGYCDLFGRDGMQHFVDSTFGWYGTIRNDRDRPLYPRAVPLSSKQLTEIDALVNTKRAAGDV